MSTAHVSKEEQEQGVFDEDSCFSAAASSTSNPTFSTSTSASTAAVAAVAAASTAAVTTTSTATPTASTSSSSSSPPPSISVSASASATTSASGAVGGHRIFGPNDNGNNNLFTASKSLLGRDGTGSSSDTDDGPSLTAIRQKLRHFFRLRNDVAQAREASIKAFELAVPPVAPVPAHQSESNVCDSQPKCRDIGLQRDCPSRRMAKAALLSVWTREYVSQAQHIQERKNFMRKVVTQTQVNAKKLQAQKMLLNTVRIVTLSFPHVLTYIVDKALRLFGLANSCLGLSCALSTSFSWIGSTITKSTRTVASCLTKYVFATCLCSGVYAVSSLCSPHSDAGHNSLAKCSFQPFFILFLFKGARSVRNNTHCCRAFDAD